MILANSPLVMRSPLNINQAKARNSADLGWLCPSIAEKNGLGGGADRLE